MSIITANEIHKKTNHKPRFLSSFVELTEAQREDFTYLDEEEYYSPRFFQFRGSFYDTNEFTRSDMAEYDGIQTCSYFDAVAIKYTEDMESVVVTYLHW